MSPPPADYDATNKGVTRISLDTVAGKEGKVTIKAVFQGDN
ncbi:MAG: hypothetical protein N2A42_02465 [Luteolibacter sp.]